MPALANLVMFNGAASPVSQTFNIETSGLNNQGVFTWRNRGSGVPVRSESISYSSKRGRGSNLLVHQFKIVVPITDTPSGGLERQVAQCMFDARIYVPDAAILDKRKDFKAYIGYMFKDLPAFPVIIQDGESFY